MSEVDVTNAYVEALIDKLIFMMLPRELFSDSNGKPIVVELLKSLYGLKQAGEIWNRLLNEKFINLGFTCLAHDQCVYAKRNNNIINSTVSIIGVFFMLTIFCLLEMIKQVEIDNCLKHHPNNLLKSRTTSKFWKSISELN
jgi:hypothetical protein